MPHDAAPPRKPDEADIRRWIEEVRAADAKADAETEAEIAHERRRRHGLTPDSGWPFGAEGDGGWLDVDLGC